MRTVGKIHCCRPRRRRTTTLSPGDVLLHQQQIEVLLERSFFHWFTVNALVVGAEAEACDGATGSNVGVVCIAYPLGQSEKWIATGRAGRVAISSSSSMRAAAIQPFNSADLTSGGPCGPGLGPDQSSDPRAPLTRARQPSALPARQYRSRLLPPRPVLSSRPTTRTHAGR